MLDLGLTDTCRAIRRDGKPCTQRASALGYCLFHDPTPDAQERRVQNARAAGKASVKARRQRAARARALGPINLKTVEDALELVQQTVSEIREGVMDVSRARLQLKAAALVLQHTSTREIEERLRDLEDLVKEYELGDSEGVKRLIETKKEMWRSPRRAGK